MSASAIAAPTFQLAMLPARITAHSVRATPCSAASPRHPARSSRRRRACRSIAHWLIVNVTKTLVTNTAMSGSSRAPVPAVATRAMAAMTRIPGAGASRPLSRDRRLGR
jgi:hypothetical protein